MPKEKQFRLFETKNSPQTCLPKLSYMVFVIKRPLHLVFQSTQFPHLFMYFPEVGTLHALLTRMVNDRLIHVHLHIFMSVL